MLPSLFHFTRRRLIGPASVLVLAVLGAVSLYAVATDSDAGQLLASELPAGVTLSTASSDQLVSATRRAVRREPKMAVKVVRVAIISKKPKRSAAAPATAGATTKRKQKSERDADELDVCPPCELVVALARAAIEGAPEEARRVIEEASILCPSCADALNGLSGDPGLGLGFGGPSDSVYGFGTGFGPGFPGSPGFFGSPPGGVLALTPTLPDVSPNVNP